LFVTISQGATNPKPPEDTLLQVIIITRHGDRTPTKLFPNTKSIWEEGLGQLTHVGMKEHFELGQRFRKIYAIEQKFINDTYKMNEIYVRSTPRERTLMSAHSFMLGLYHNSGPESLPGKIQPVPIYSSDRNTDFLLYGYKNCAKLKKLGKDVQTSDEWLQKTNEHSGLLSELSTIFGGKLLLKDVTAVLNLVNGEKIHSKPSPIGVTHDMMNKMKDVANFVFRRKSHTREMGKLGAGLLVQEIRDRMNRTMSFHATDKRPGDQRFILFSAHDGTLLALMSALELNHLELPHYASHLVFELRFNADLGYYVNIVYNGEGVHYGDCGLDCPFDQFSVRVQPGVPANWQAECQLEVAQELRFNILNAFPFIFGFVLGGFVMGVISFYKGSKEKFK